MNFTSFETLFLVLIFLAPGYVMHAVIATLAPRSAEPAHTAFLRFLALSSVNFASFAWLLPVVPFPKSIADVTPRVALGVGVLTIIGPAVLGFVVGLVQSKRAVYRVLRWARLAPAHGTPSAWNWKFNSLSVSRFVTVTMKGGAKVNGWFGRESLAASTQDSGDIYIQEVFRVDDAGAWQRLERNDGMLIPRDSIQYVEFVRDTEDDQGHA